MYLNVFDAALIFRGLQTVPSLLCDNLGDPGDAPHWNKPAMWAVAVGAM